MLMLYNLCWIQFAVPRATAPRLTSSGKHKLFCSNIHFYECLPSNKILKAKRPKNAISSKIIKLKERVEERGPHVVAEMIGWLWNRSHARCIIILRSQPWVTKQQYVIEAILLLASIWQHFGPAITNRAAKTLFYYFQRLLIRFVFSKLFFLLN